MNAACQRSSLVPFEIFLDSSPSKSALHELLQHALRYRAVTMAMQVSESDQIKQFKEFLGTYNKVTENCFMDCVKDFTTREVKPEESSCSESCLQKYLKMTQRISMRFQEYHIQQNEALAAKAGLLGQPR
ncbi:hypothetical protein OJAV_G00218420 [Oryzias javanicus]|uniref:Mitochondrial import inner membrane translocase subunit n=2 Tax=Oryzias TaxID=8089 RepID=A0A437C4X3_ORYJA|nr:hypothetical protein OJAV_G00218420 [Oryzias javanicus]